MINEQADKPPSPQLGVWECYKKEKLKQPIYEQRFSFLFIYLCFWSFHLIQLYKDRTLSVVVKSTIDTRINHHIICYSPVITKLLSGSTTTDQTAIACYFHLCKSCHVKKNCSVCVYVGLGSESFDLYNSDVSHISLCAISKEAIEIHPNKDWTENENFNWKWFRIFESTCFIKITNS